MDEAGKLVSELQFKLGGLDHKVWQYRRDMANEFTKYAEDILHDVPKEVSETVHKAIAESIKDYKALFPDATYPAESPAIGTNMHEDEAAGGLPSTPFGLSTPSNSHRKDTGDREEGPRSPHDREKEFQGLFTPSYLPLLDSTDRNERISSYSPQPTPTLDKRKGKEMETFEVDGATDRKSVARSPDRLRPSTPRRRNTDEVSVSSDTSEGTARRSALRRSSSSAKAHSPRRVRFDVSGEEVLPTASPLPEQPISAETIPSTPLGATDSDDETGLEQIEDVEEPPPKRISSSQALRALSRNPLEDDGTEWTTVSAGPDGSASMITVNGGSQDSSSEDLPSSSPQPLNFPKSITNRTPLSMPTNHSRSEIDTGDDGAEVPSEDDMLDMPPLRTIRGPASMLSSTKPSAKPSSNDKSNSLTASMRSQTKPFAGLDNKETGGDGKSDGAGDWKFLEDELHEPFPLDEDSDQSSTQDAPQEESDPESPVSPTARTEPVSLSQYSSSPARGIAKTSAAKPANTRSKGVVGSYKGHPFSMPIVSDEIHAQAASLGDISSFIGSVDGRSGVDESDGHSYRATRGGRSPMGAPRSLSERMMLDEVFEAGTKQKKK